MSLELLNGSLVVNVFFDPKDRDFEDNVCICLKEFGPDEEKILYADETNILITSEQARELGNMLIKAADQSNHASR